MFLESPPHPPQKIDLGTHTCTDMDTQTRVHSERFQLVLYMHGQTTNVSFPDSAWIAESDLHWGWLGPSERNQSSSKYTTINIHLESILSIQKESNTC